MSSIPHVPLWPGEKNVRGPGPYRIDAFAACPQKEGFGYEMRLTPAVEKDPMMIGSLVHAALAYHYGAMLPVRPPWMVYTDPYNAVTQLGTLSGRVDLIEPSQRIFAWYINHYQMDPWKPVLVEHQFQWNFGGDKYLTARVDLIAAEPGLPGYTLVDHKIKGRITRNTGSSLSLDRQMLTNLVLARANGVDVQRVYINGITRDFPEPQFGRFSVPVSAEAYAHFAQDTDYYLAQRSAVRKAYPDPANRPRNTAACMGPYGACDFRPLCEDGPARLVEYRKREY